jgi:hypothetical protein
LHSWQLAAFSISQFSCPEIRLPRQLTDLKLKGWIFVAFFVKCCIFGFKQVLARLVDIF